MQGRAESAQQVRDLKAEVADLRPLLGAEMAACKDARAEVAKQQVTWARGCMHVLSLRRWRAWTTMWLVAFLAAELCAMRMQARAEK